MGQGRFQPLPAATPQAPEGRSRQMSDLIVIGYENPQTARQAYEQVQRLQQDFVSN